MIFQTNTISYVLQGQRIGKMFLKMCVALTNNTENLELIELLLSFYSNFYFSGPGCSKVG